MLADMLMLGRGITRSFGELLESRGYELRLTPKGTLPFDTEATVIGFATLRDSVASVAGVERVAPVLAASVTVEASDDSGRSVEALALGMDSGDQGLYRLTEGDMAPARRGAHRRGRPGLARRGARERGATASRRRDGGLGTPRHGPGLRNRRVRLRIPRGSADRHAPRRPAGALVPGRPGVLRDDPDRRGVRTRFGARRDPGPKRPRGNRDAGGASRNASTRASPISGRRR